MRMFAVIIWTFIAVGMPFSKISAQQKDIQGHRGARGLMPENTVPSFLKALDFGVTTVEMDVVITADSLVLVSHDHYFSSNICLDPQGKEIKSRDAKEHNIFKMTYEKIESYDCGSIGNKAFPAQEKITVAKPLLRDVIKAVEMHVKSYTLYEVDYNIEIKSSPSGDNKFHPDPNTFSDLVYKEIDQYLPWNRVVIQSFDNRVLQYWHEQYPEVRLSMLVETPGAVSSKLGELGFHPAIFSPHFKLLNQQKVDYLHELGIKVIPWTVNETAQMENLIKMGVDGIITDYPDRAASLGLTLKLNEEQ